MNKTEWTTELPKDEGFYLATSKYGGYAVVGYSHNLAKMNTWGDLSEENHSGFWYHDEDGFHEYKEAIAWMKIPEYKEGE